MSLLLETNALSVGYKKKIILENISFRLHAGEVLTLIGPNGAGKSTVLRTIANQLAPISGDVILCGKSLSLQSEKDIARQLSALFTERITAERMTCFDVAAAGRYPYTGMLGVLSDNDKHIVRRSLEMVGAAELADVDFNRLSDGQRQIIMLARAIAQEPSVLLLDEPTSYLDISRKLDFLCLLRNLAKERGIAVIQSLHELDLAQRFSDLVLCVQDGKAQKIGSPEEIFCGDYISDLYRIQNGRYDTLYGTPEPAAFQGQPQIFVIGGGGTAIPVCRKLYRSGIPFAAGVIHENDLDFPVIRSNAAKFISAAPFEPISEAQYHQALDLMSQCESVICSVARFGTMNIRNRDLCMLAEKQGKRITEI